MSGKESSEQHGIGCSSSKTNVGFSTKQARIHVSCMAEG